MSTKCNDVFAAKKNYKFFPGVIIPFVLQPNLEQASYSGMACLGTWLYELEGLHPLSIWLLDRSVFFLLRNICLFLF